MEYGFPKTARLCAQVAIDRLFAPHTPKAGKATVDTHSALVFPLRAVWAENPGRTRGDSVQVLFSIPKRRLHHAVDRVAMRRRLRQAYRLLRPTAIPQTTPVPVDLMLIYVADRQLPYANIDRALRRLLPRIFPK